LRLRAKTGFALAACHNGQPDCTPPSSPQRYVIETKGESETYKRRKWETRTIRQIHKDLTYHIFSERRSFSIM
ncbi:hypothetical protein TNCV_1619281, partial [Trichonephila clavipes]